jgi:hypothetical protein
MQQLNPSEISELIRERIAGFQGRVETRSQGTIISLGDGILRIHGLEDVMYGEMLELPGGKYALALNLEQDNVGAVVLGEFSGLEEGDVVKCTGKVMQVPIGKALLGRVVNTLGQPVDGKGPVDTQEFDILEKIAPGVGGGNRTRVLRLLCRPSPSAARCTSSGPALHLADVRSLSRESVPTGVPTPPSGEPNWMTPGFGPLGEDRPDVAT